MKIDLKAYRNVAGRDKQLNVPDTSLASLLRIPPSSTPIREEKQYYVDDSVCIVLFLLPPLFSTSVLQLKMHKLLFIYVSL
jgi:hypothetical protein